MHQLAAHQPDCNQAPQVFSPTQSDLRVLVIDDDPADRQLYRYFLSSDPRHSYTITEVGLGKKALKLCTSEDFHCILLDYYLSDLSGLEFLTQYQQILQGGIPVIMLTGQGNETIAADSLRAGAADYMPKRNVSANSLQRAVGNTIEKYRLRNAITKQNLELKEKNKELTRKHDEIQRFYQTVSHELKTPLTAMQEFVSIILDGLAGPITEEQNEYLGLVRESCLQMTNDVNDLLDITRLETGKYRVETAPTNLEVVLNNIVQTMRVLAGEKSIELKLCTAKNLPLIPADVRRVEQVLTNLIGNAIKFTHSQGRVHVIADFDDENKNCIKITVRDNGCGIEPENLAHIFDRLYQVNPETNTGSMASSKCGLGLGLAISNELVQLHGGKMTVDSEYGKGSVFAFTLPIYQLHDSSGKAR